MKTSHYYTDCRLVDLINETSPSGCVMGAANPHRTKHRTTDASMTSFYKPTQYGCGFTFANFGNHKAT